jgi:hypothetical protein
MMLDDVAGEGAELPFVLHLLERGGWNPFDCPEGQGLVVVGSSL